MATVRRRGKAWQATVRGPDGRERTRTYPKKVDAERWASTQEADKARGSWIDPTAGRVTFGQFALAWAEGQVWRPTTVEGVRRRLELHLLPYLGDVPLATLRPGHLQTWVKGRSQVLAPSTVALCVQTVRSVLRAAVADRLIAASPANGLKMPRADRVEVVPLTLEQVAAIREAMPARYQAAVTLAAGAGLRQGELFGLTVDRVDWLRRTITIDRQLVTVTGQGTALAPPKTDHSRRTIPVPDVVLSALSAHLAEFPPGPDGLIFTNEQGQPISRNRTGHLWRAASSRAKLPEGSSWHDLRHWFASVLIGAGESVKVVQTRLGHASAAITLDTYTHLWPSDEDRTRDAVGAALVPPADIPRTSAQA